MVAVLLCSDAGQHDLEQRVVRVAVDGVVDHQGLDDLEGGVQRVRVALDDFGGVQAHAQQVLCILQQLAGKAHDQVCAVAHLVVLLLRRADEQFCGGVHDLELAHDCGGVGGDKELLEVVDDHLVAAVGAKRGAGDGHEVPGGLDVAVDGLFEALHVLVAVLEHGGQAHLWDLERHWEEIRPFFQRLDLFKQSSLIL